MQKFNFSSSQQLNQTAPQPNIFDLSNLVNQKQKQSNPEEFISERDSQIS